MIGTTRTPRLFLVSRFNAMQEDEGPPPWMGHMTPLPAVKFMLTGVSRDSAGAALAGCTCTLFRVNTTGALPVFTQVNAVVSDGSGNFSFVVGGDGPWRVTYDLDGAPIRAGISLRTLTGV